MRQQRFREYLATEMRPFLVVFLVLCASFTAETTKELLSARVLTLNTNVNGGITRFPFLVEVGRVYKLPNGQP